MIRNKNAGEPSKHLVLSKSGRCVQLYSSARNLLNHARDYQVQAVERDDSTTRAFRLLLLIRLLLQPTPELSMKRKSGYCGGIVVAVWAESSSGVERSLLCNFLSVQIGRSMGRWWARHGNLTSIICLLTSASVVSRSHSPVSGRSHKVNQPAGFSAIQPDRFVHEATSESRRLTPSLQSSIKTLLI